ncbi:hypothetical protein [Pedobacter frigoris]|uniref:Uncharacterized protein n=1 Tax=Pedobacter frigoris TaxID=2571272 RepID=A0A4U1CLR5_9SPHI|nr:hypothetical protein [Pedobacter frigoris]TKC06140.1 hypothetical protein FA047_12495 [Pedobacter frigoris]
MKASENEKFTVSVKTGNFKNGHIAVQQAETTDGQPYYICEVDGKEVQLRHEGKWEQIWGDLNAEQIDELGSVINKHLHL